MPCDIGILELLFAEHGSSSCRAKTGGNLKRLKLLLGLVLMAVSTTAISTTAYAGPCTGELEGGDVFDSVRECRALVGPVTDPLYNQDGDVAVGPTVPFELLPALKQAPTGQVWEILAYESGVDGPLDPASGYTGTGIDAASANQRRHAFGKVCSLFFPDTLHYRDRDSATPNGYYGNTGANCETSANVAIYCSAELFRVSDGAKIDAGVDSGNESEYCLATVDSGRRYRKRNKHYTSAFVSIKILDGAKWGSGPSPRGWKCNGQKTAEINCYAISTTAE